MRRWALGAMLFWLGWAAAGADVTVTATGAKKVNLGISGFTAAGEFGGSFLKTLENDLRLSGWFTVVRGGNGLVNLSGRLDESGDSLEAQCEVINTQTGKQHLKQSYEDKKTHVRRLAHAVADAIVMAVRGQPGIAGTRIVMVGSRKGGKNLYIVDADGGGLIQLTRDNAPCLAPTWAPNGQRIVYTSFHAGYPDVYEINLATSLRTRLAAFPGINSGAVISPDGKEMVLTLSKDGNPDLYTIASGSRQAVRLTRTPDAAEASPSWSPDGRRIAYVSDRSGTPQVYVTDRNGQKLTRLTFRGDQNVAPDWGPSGLIAYSSRLGGRFQICVLDPAKGTPTQLTDGGYDCEDPSWAPDGRHIVYARSSGFHSEVYVLDISGDPQVRLLQMEGDWYAPSWSPNSKGKR